MKKPQTNCRNCNKPLSPPKRPPHTCYCSRKCGHDWWNSLRKHKKPFMRRCSVCDKKLGKGLLEKKYCKKCHLATRRTRERCQRHGITIEEFQVLSKAQHNQCVLCGSKNRLVLDHDHVTDKLRCLLCWPCNLGLGMFKDDPAKLRAAADYIDRFRFGSDTPANPKPNNELAAEVGGCVKPPKD